MVEPMREQHYVVAGLLRRRGRALLVHRSPQRLCYPNVWDLPGGHGLPGEPSRRALARELREELGVTTKVTGEPFARSQGSDFQMDIWLIDVWTGEPSNPDPLEHDALRWVTEPELPGLQLADPRLPRLPRTALDPSQCSRTPRGHRYSISDAASAGTQGAGSGRWSAVGYFRKPCRVTSAIRSHRRPRPRVLPAAVRARTPRTRA